MPDTWSKQDGLGKTRSGLIQDRKRQLMPHISFDLDGDGIVGGRDLVVASRFDADCDGKLSSVEREAAIKALREDNYEGKFVWGIEQSGANCENRIIQKRGLIIKGDDFTVLKKTYPEHPLSQEPRRHINRADLMNKRKARNVSEMDKQKQDWDQANPSHIDQRQLVRNEYYVENPEYATLSHKKAALKQVARVKIGLNENFTDLRVSSKDPTLKFVHNPDVINRSSL